MNKPELIKITVEGGYTPNKALQLTINPDSTMDEWVEVFKTILVFQTFNSSQIEELFDLYEEKILE
jgi:hypothetical protein